MPSAKDLLTTEQQEQVIKAIQQAEDLTSGEIRVHIEESTRRDGLLRAEEIFTKLGMHKTEDRNGILIYVAVKDHKLAIIGDKGINDLVGTNFWDDERDVMVEHFKKGEYAEGLIKAIGLIGIELKKYFPRKKQDANELPDEISFGPK